MDSNIIKINQYMTQQEEDQFLKDNNYERLPARELMALPYEEYKDYLPCRSSTEIEYKSGSTTAYLTENGKRKKIDLPPQDSYYKLGKDGIPNGKKSVSSDPEARYLVRYQTGDYKGLVVRRDDGFYGFDGGRRVDCIYRPYDRFRVLVRSCGLSHGKKTYEDGIRDGIKQERKRIKKSIINMLGGVEMEFEIGWKGHEMKSFKYFEDLIKYLQWDMFAGMLGSKKIRVEVIRVE